MIFIFGYNYTTLLNYASKYTKLVPFFSFSLISLTICYENKLRAISNKHMFSNVHMCNNTSYVCLQQNIFLFDCNDLPTSKSINIPWHCFEIYAFIILTSTQRIMFFISFCLVFRVFFPLIHAINKWYLLFCSHLNPLQRRFTIY